jgi:hypothetical protein
VRANKCADLTDRPAIRRSIVVQDRAEAQPVRQ